MNQETADLVKNMVRDFLKTGLKSTNKLYAKSSEATVYKRMKGGVESERTVTPEMKAKRLKSAQVEVQLELKKIRDSRAKPSGCKTPLAYGELLCKQGVPIGNCTEMASLAIFFLRVEPVDCYLAQIADPGDHVFCVVSPSRPMAESISKIKDEANAWVIDPWANIACPAANYMALLRAKFETWNAAGKRVAFKNSTEAGWTSPTESKYQVQTLFSKLQYTAGNEKFPGLS